MKPKTAPTSPKYPLDHPEEIQQVWQQPEIQQPTRTPVVTIIIWTLVFSIISLVMLVAGAAWYLRLHPDSPLKEYFPSTVTTVIQNMTGSNTTDTPKNVVTVRDTAIPLAVDPGADGVLTDGQIKGLGLAVSTSGWVMTLNSALPSASHVVGLSSTRKFIEFNAAIKDPASPLVFLPTTSTDLQPVSFADPQSVTAGQIVWVIIRNAASGLAIHRQLLPAATGWKSCDRLVPAWTLDEPISAPPGSPVVNDRGQLIGLLDDNQNIWPVNGLDQVLKTLFEQKIISRPACGFSYTWLANSIRRTDQAAAGYLIGSGSGGVAITPKGPADVAGLRTGDVITAVDGVPVDHDWSEIFRTARLGQTLKLTITRGGTEKTINLKLGILKP